MSSEPGGDMDELGEMLDRFAELSDAATRACETTLVDVLEQALEARGAILTRAAMLVPRLGEEPLPPAIRAKLQRLERADRDLGQLLQGATASLQQELGAVRAELVRVGGYAAAVPRFRRLDTLR